MSTTLIYNSIAALLSILVLSRIAGDNPIFRISQYFFVGLSLGFSLVILWSRILLMWQPTLRLGYSADLALLVIPFVLGVMLLARLGSVRLSWLANLPLGILFGVAAALAIGGALLGTLMPQLRATAFPAQGPADMAGIIGRWVVLPLGMILVLISFTYRVKPESRRRPVWRFASGTGRWLLIVSLGAVFAGSMLTYLTALVERVSFLISALSMRG